MPLSPASSGPRRVLAFRARREALHIETKLRTVQASMWFDEAQDGNVDIAISAVVSTLMEPSDYFNSWYGKDGPQTYSRWSNREFHDLV